MSVVAVTDLALASVAAATAVAVMAAFCCVNVDFAADGAAALSSVCTSRCSTFRNRRAWRCEAADDTGDSDGDDEAEADEAKDAKEAEVAEVAEGDFD